MLPCRRGSRGVLSVGVRLSAVLLASFLPRPPNFCQLHPVPRQGVGDGVDHRYGPQHALVLALQVPHHSNIFCLALADGEIVADNDPRAVAKRKSQAPASTPQRAPAVAGGAGGSNVRSGAPPAGGGAAGPTGSPLDALAAAIGIEGQVVTIPRLHARVPPRDVPMVVAGLLGVATLFFGWRLLALAAALHVVSGFSETAAPGAAATGGGGGRPGQRPA